MTAKKCGCSWDLDRSFFDELEVGGEPRPVRKNDRESLCSLEMELDVVKRLQY